MTTATADGEANPRIRNDPQLADGEHDMTWSSKTRAFWPLLLSVFLTDCATKQIATERLAPAYRPHEVLGDWLRFVLAYNRGAAIGIPLGSWARPLLAA